MFTLGKFDNNLNVITGETKCGIKQIQERLHTIAKEHQDEYGHWVEDPNLTVAFIQVNQSITLRDLIKEYCKAGFQKTIEEILYKKSKVAFEEFKKINSTNKNKFVVAGGVAANNRIREVLTSLCKEENFETIFPPINLCGDNAAMIAMVGLEKFRLNQFSELDSPTKPRLSLDADTAFLKGAGVRL